MLPTTPNFDWQEYLVLAERLAVINAESAKRSAISRAYYAAFRKAEFVYMRANPVFIPDDGKQSHYIVWEWFKKHQARPYKQIGNSGDRLKKSRIRADYSDTFPGLEQQTSYQMKVAKELIESLDQIANSFS